MFSIGIVILNNIVVRFMAQGRWKFCKGTHSWNGGLINSMALLLRIILEGNEASAKMMDKLGCIQEGIRRQVVSYINGEFMDFILYGINERRICWKAKRRAKSLALTSDGQMWVKSEECIDIWQQYIHEVAPYGLGLWMDPGKRISKYIRTSWIREY